MDNYENEIQMAQVMVKAKRRLSAQEKLEKIVEELKPRDRKSEVLFGALVTLADLLDSMDYLESSLNRRNEAISVAIELLGLKHTVTVDQLIARANTSWGLLDKQEERSNILKCAKDTATNIGEVVKMLRMVPNYPNAGSIIEDMRQKMTCAMMIIEANQQIDRMVEEKQKSIEDMDLDDPYAI